MNTRSARRIELWVEERNGRPAINPVIKMLLDDLLAAGTSVVVRVPEQELVDPLRLLHERTPDLVLLKSATTLALSLALADEAAGVRFLNRAGATVRANDKAATVARLAAAGLPVPRTWLRDAAARDIPASPDDVEAWVAKPVRGVHGTGVSMHAGWETALRAAGTIHDGGKVVDDGTRLLQQRAGPAEHADLKVYVAGEAVFAGAKRFSDVSYAVDHVTAKTLDRWTEAIVRAAGVALELRCFGVDLRFEQGAPVIIDANPFPGYRGFPAAAGALRAEIERVLGAAD